MKPSLDKISDGDLIVFNHKGEALGDAGMGANAFAPDLNSELQIKHTARVGNNHLWPTNP